VNVRSENFTQRRKEFKENKVGFHLCFSVFSVRNKSVLTVRNITAEAQRKNKCILSVLSVRKTSVSSVRKKMSETKQIDFGNKQ
jgi:hypothetical protein